MIKQIPAEVSPRLVAVSEEFMRCCYDILGAYLDALAGLESVRSDLVRGQQCIVSQLKLSAPEKANEAFMDQQIMRYEFEGDHQGPIKLLHRSTQGEFKTRTSAHGLDARLLGHMAVTLLYSLWEDTYREKIALVYGHSCKNDLKGDLFGDLGSLRHAIVHNNGIATEKIEQAKLLKWFSRGDTIFLSPAHVDQLFDSIDAYMTQLCSILVSSPS